MPCMVCEKGAKTGTIAGWGVCRGCREEPLRMALQQLSELREAAHALVGALGEAERREITCLDAWWSLQFHALKALLKEEIPYETTK